jgi:hypothetical protein
MSIYKKTSTLAVRQVFHPESWGAVAEAFAKDSARVFGHVAEEATGRIVGDWAKAVAEKVRGHLTDHSELLSKALAESNERAWKALEIGLGGQRFWDRFASAEDQALRDQVRDFLTSALKEDDPGYLAACLKELRQARENGLLAPGEGFILASVADEISPFARFDDPEALLAAECTIVEQIAREFHRLGHRHLGRLLAVSPTRGQPLLAMAAQYYFRRAVGEDAVLSREITWVKLNTIDRNVQDGFAFLAMIQERHGRTVEEALDGLARLEIVVGETHDAVLSLHDDVRGLIDQFKLSRRDLTPAHAVSYRDEDEKQLIEAVKRRYRALSDDQRRRFPQIGLDLSRLDVVAGDFKSALAEAREAAEMSTTRARRPKPTTLHTGPRSSSSSPMRPSSNCARLRPPMPVSPSGRRRDIKSKKSSALVLSGSRCYAGTRISATLSSSSHSSLPGSIETSPRSSGKRGFCADCVIRGSLISSPAGSSTRAGSSGPIW